MYDEYDKPRPPPRDYDDYDRGPPPRGPPPRRPPPYGAPPPYPRAPRGIGAGLGMAIMIIAIVGLVLFYVLPWFSQTVEVEQADGDKKKYSGSWNHDLEWMDGDRELNPDKDDWWEGFNDGQDFLRDTTFMVFLGLIFAMIIGIMAMVFGFIPYIHARYPRVGNSLDAIFGAITILAAVMILFSAMRFIGGDIEEYHIDAMTEDLGGDVSSWNYYYGAYAILIIGIIILVVSFILMFKGMNRMRFAPGSRPPPVHERPPRGPPPRGAGGPPPGDYPPPPPPEYDYDGGGLI